MHNARTKLVEAMASGLGIKIDAHVEKDDTFQFTGLASSFVRVSEETQEAFKKLLKEDMTKKLLQTKEGHTLEYVFDCGEVKGYTNTLDVPKKNLEQILRKLPQLPKNQKYCFPDDTVLCFRVLRKDEHVTDVQVTKISSWIEKEYLRM